MTARELNGAGASERRVWKVKLGCLGVAVLLGIGLWANMPYLAVEHRRLELWQVVGLWTGDVMGLLWFGRFAVVHAVLGEPLAPVQLSDGRRRLKLVALAGLAAMAVDLAFTLYLMHDEQSGYARGRVAQAQVFAVQEHKRPAATGYDLDCRFTDEAGVRHEAHLRVLADHHALPATLPPEAVRVLSERSIRDRQDAYPTGVPAEAAGVSSARGEGQNLIRIRYEPRLPERAWIDGLGWEDDNGLYWFSVGTLCLQAGVTAIFLLLLGRHSAGGVWPWWWDIYKALPLAAEAFCMLMMGLIDRVMDSLA